MNNMGCQVLARQWTRGECCRACPSTTAPQRRPVSSRACLVTFRAVERPRRAWRRIAAASLQDYSGGVAGAREESMKEYLELKRFLLQRCQRFGGFFTIYIFLVVSGKAALCSMLGSAGGYLYLAWLCRDIDNIAAVDPFYSRRADSASRSIAYSITKAAASYRTSLQPRLLVPVILAAGIALYNAKSGDTLTLAEEGCVLGGFLSYKVALVQKIWEDTRPRFSRPPPKRPQWKEIDDELDMYGREKVKSVGVQEAERVLAEQEAKEAAAKEKRFWGQK